MKNLKITQAILLLLACVVILPSCETTNGQKQRDREASLISTFLKENPDYKLQDNGVYEKMIEEGTKEYFTNERTEKKDSTVVRVGDRLKVVYKGTFIDGREQLIFDEKNYEPLEVIVGTSRVITAWTTSLIGKYKKAKFEIMTPSDFAYGPNGDTSTGRIGPYEPLKFEMYIKKVYRLDKEGEWVEI
ncbi:hypothetical protein EMN47_02800 [Prolixibacteraceae bacterium JC049]|nr:hypothetical protein [Prolixibacteraceae bacterium JC049]